MKTLIVKLGATGDVVRTTPLLRRLQGQVTWLTSEKNRSLVEGVAPNVRVLSWKERDAIRREAFSLVLSLEDESEIGQFVSELTSTRVVGAYLDRNSCTMRYTRDANSWFDLSLISVHGRRTADHLKFLNRKSYQEHLFEAVGLEFAGERYLLPGAEQTGLCGDVAISPVAGPVWPMKAWAHYSKLKNVLEAEGLVVNVLPTRASLLEHLADVQGHRCVVSGDSLPMHLALGSGVRCVTLFNCTSPWEIHDYGIQKKLISPLLEEHFYKRAFDPRATTAVPLEDVLAAVVTHLRGSEQPSHASVPLVS